MRKKSIEVSDRFFDTYLSRAVILNEGRRNSMTEWVSRLGYHVLSHKKSQIY